MHHLLPLIYMINGGRLDPFSYVVVATGNHVDVMPVLWLWLVESFDDEKLHSTTNFLLCQAILLSGYILRVGWLREVLVHNLLQGSFVLALEHILKHHNGVREVKMIFSAPFLKSGIDLLTVNSTPSFPVTRIVALQLISLGQLGLLVPCLF
jgi:hypothetical protein